ncbi:TraB/GumN family protein [Croceicoccus bisphenolivorans]|uniref:TraB/GumN family protein n=1 Tax=Croceicoccus bisphenolivorans TaxID=1783232 RepID=UPI000832F55B|nr:TraB/GumN family protein [Croceicoccus bisphenolivorans]
MPTRLLPLLLAPFVLLLAACGSTAEPALWRIDKEGAGADAAPAGYLFGTIHALPRGTDWHGETLDAALADAGVLMVEIKNLDKGDAQRIFQELALDASLPPIDERVSPMYRDELDEVMDRAGADPENFHFVETWATALTLSTMLQARSSMDPDNSVDQSLIADWQGRPIIGLETAEEQFRIFDQLSGNEQQALLESMVRQADEMEPDALAKAWSAGDADAMSGLMELGFESNTGLRAAILGRRNQRWVGPILNQVQSGKKPFVAVGAGHMGGDDGLIALLAARGYKATRIQ